MSAHSFHLIRLGFRFRAKQRVAFPQGRTANLIRGLFGAALLATAPPVEYARLFAPNAQLGKSPSGLADWPRPFVFRAAHLDGTAAEPGESFCMDVHLFDARDEAVAAVCMALERVASDGIGHARGSATLDEMEREAITLDLKHSPADLNTREVRLRFVTPTELKHDGRTALQPDFAILFGRLRERISNLSALYGGGSLKIDFAHSGDRAREIRLLHSELHYEFAERRSRRTGQVHPLGGFVGEAGYEGELGEFLPWLRAAHWVGVGRQTVWGKGDVRVIS
jgi:hypothetical protein